jgi:hypothetical protein
MDVQIGSQLMGDRRFQSAGRHKGDGLRSMDVQIGSQLMGDRRFQRADHCKGGGPRSVDVQIGSHLMGDRYEAIGDDRTNLALATVGPVDLHALQRSHPRERHRRAAVAHAHGAGIPRDDVRLRLPVRTRDVRHSRHSLNARVG